MAFLASAKLLLNQYSKTQPSLQEKDSQNGAPLGLKVGDILDNLSHCAVDSRTFEVNAVSGTVGAHATSLVLPAGAIVTRVYTDELVNVTSSGAATIQLLAGSTSLVAAQLFSAFASAQSQTVVSAPVKLAVDSPLTVTVAVAALTGGSLRIFVEYLKPVLVPYQA